MMFFKSRTTPHKTQRPLPKKTAFNSDIFQGLESLEPRLLLSGTAFEVNTLTDISDPNDTLLTLREAIVAANTNTALGNIPAGTPASSGVDIITFNQPALQQEAGPDQPLTITLNGTQLQITESLTIQGLGQDILTIDANQLSRVFYIPGEQTNVRISDLTITGGYEATRGGGIHNFGILSLDNSVVSDNSLTRNNARGGGIYNQGALTLTHSTVTRNSIRDRKPIGAVSGAGAGIANEEGSLTLLNSVISENSIQQAGYGGGIYNSARYLTIINSKILGNSIQQSGRGGGIHISSALTFILTNSIISNNHAKEGGGINIYNVAQATLTNSTITGNNAEKGGGVYSIGPLTINNCIVANNKASQYNNISDDYNTTTTNNSLLNIDPQFVRNPSPGTDGIWATADDDYGDLHLTDSSLAVNLGNNAHAINHEGLPLTGDFENNPRIIDGQVDAGAYEFDGTPSLLIESFSSVVTTLEDTTNSTDGLTSLREAIYYAHQLAITNITFAPSFNSPTITLNGNPLEFLYPVTIDATPFGGLTIDADQQSGVVKTLSTDTQISFIGLTLTNGNNSGILNHGLLALTNTTISGNSTNGSGGGIKNSSGTITLTNSTVTDNSASSHGGGIYNNYSNNMNCTITLTNSTVTNNSATSQGGGIYNYGSECTITLINSPVTGNSSNSEGGGIYNRFATLALTHSTIASNSSLSGGGIYIASGKVSLTNSTVSDNIASNSGGGIYNDICQLVLTNSSITGNSTFGDGGGIYNDGYLILNNSTLTGNSAQYGGAIYNIDRLTLNNSIVTFNHADDSTFDTLGPFTNNSSLISTDPLFIANPTPGPDQTWGTPDDTPGDLHLQPNSPAINAGDTSLLPLNATDFDLANSPRVNGGTVDIGAYESQLYNTADFNLDHKVNIADLIQWAQNFGQTTSTTTPATLFTKGDANLDNKINIADLIQWAQNFGQTSAPPALAAPLNSGALTQTSNAIADTPQNTTPSNSFLLNTPQPDRWADIKNLLNPTTDPTQQKLNIIQSITSPI